MEEPGKGQLDQGQHLPRAGRKEKEQRGPAPGAPEPSLLELRGGYGSNLMAEVARYSEAAEALARREAFDVIHTHDWLTIPAGLRARRVSGKPLLVHMHALEFDRSGENINRDIYAIETRDYGIRPNRTRVVVPRWRLVAICRLGEVAG